MSELVSLVVVGSRATITFDHGRMNSLTPAMLDSLVRCVERARELAEVRVLVLRGAGGAFSAGADVGDPGNLAGSLEEQVARLDRQVRVVEHLRTMDATTIAVVEGACAGAGLSLALACDLRLATPGSRFRVAFASVGLSGDFGVSWTLPRLVGEARARHLFLADPKFDAQQALRWGLVSEVVADPALEPRIDELASVLGSRPALAVAAIKANLGDQGTSLVEHLAAESRRHLACAHEALT